VSLPAGPDGWFRARPARPGGRRRAGRRVPCVSSAAPAPRAPGPVRYPARPQPRRWSIVVVRTTAMLHRRGQGPGPLGAGTWAGAPGAPPAPRPGHFLRKKRTRAAFMSLCGCCRIMMFRGGPDGVTPGTVAPWRDPGHGGTPGTEGPLGAVVPRRPVKRRPAPSRAVQRETAGRILATGRLLCTMDPRTLPEALILPVNLHIREQVCG
jgi:hypothetical protein